MLADLNRNDYLFYSLKKAFSLYCVLIVMMTLGRAAFAFYFAPPALLEEFQHDVLKAFFMGWRYDTIICSYLLAPYIVGSILLSPLRFRWLSNAYFFLSKFFYFWALVVVLVFICGDFGFYSFFQDRLNILAFGLLEDDTMALLTTVWKNYPIGKILAAFAVFMFAFKIIVKKTFASLDKERSLFHPGPGKFILMSSISLVLVFGGARGGYGEFVLSPKYADFSTNLFVNQMALNGMITFEKAYKMRRQRNVATFKLEKEMGYVNGIHEAFSDYLGFDTSPTEQSQLVNLLQRRTSLNESVEERKPHVVVFIMESFGGNWIQYNSETFNFLGPLKRHIEEDFYFKNFISSENGTIGSLMVVASNIPPRPGARFLSESRYMQLPLPSSAHLPYREKGYETSFVYGGKLGWRGIGKYFQRQNYHHVEGENHIRQALGLNGPAGTEWGLYDEHLFNHVADKLKKANRPQFMLVLSTSNHPPFERPDYFHPPGKLAIPDNLKPRITREEDLFLERFKAFQYSNTVLSQFLSEVKEGDLAEETVVAFTGDHNFWGFMNYSQKESYLKYQVPFYLYLPERLRPSSYDSERLGSHEDIFPTLYNLTLSGAPYVAFGENLFSDIPSYALGSNSAAGEEGLIYKGENYSWDKIPMVKGKTDKALEKLSKAYRSSVSVADFYLRQIFKKFHSPSKE